MEDIDLKFNNGILSIRHFVEQGFIGNYGPASAALKGIIEKITDMSNLVVNVIGSESDEFRLMRFLLANTVSALEINDIYKMLDSLLQLSDFFEAFNESLAMASLN